MGIATNGQVRRTSNPLYARKIWQSIGKLAKISKEATIDNTVNDLERDGLNAVDVVNEIGKCIKDGLLTFIKMETGKVSEEDWVFTIPPDSAQAGNQKARDWYCFECHQAGQLYSCRTCFRSFHKQCISSLSEHLKVDSADQMDKPKWVCPWCRFKDEKVQSVESQSKQVSERVNRCLKIVVEELNKEFTELQEKLNTSVYYKNFVFRDTTMDKIMAMVNQSKIKTGEELEIEIRNLLHNYHCYCGAADNSQNAEGGASRTANAQNAGRNERMPRMLSTRKQRTKKGWRNELVFGVLQTASCDLCGEAQDPGNPSCQSDWLADGQ
jgi:rubrerythrin